MPSEDVPVRPHARFWQLDREVPLYHGLATDGSMAALARTFWGRLPLSTQREMSEFAASGYPQSFGTACSGTDSPVLAIDAWMKAVGELGGCPPQICHEFSCERCPAKRAFLRSMFGSAMPRLFTDLADFAADAAHDEIAGLRIPIPSVHGMIAGFPCTDVSNLNAKKNTTENRACISRGSLRTGGVFKMIVDHVRRRRGTYKWLILENVVGLAKAPKNGDGLSNLDYCCHVLGHDLNMTCVVLKLDSRYFGRLHSRSRIYMACICNNMLAAAGLDGSRACSMIGSVMDLLAGHATIDINSVLYPEAHPRVLSHLRQLQVASRAPRGTLAASASHSSGSSGPAGATARAAPSCSSEPHARKKPRKQEAATPWPVLHAERFARLGLDWSLPSAFQDPSLRELFPGVLALTHRQMDILDCQGVGLPDARARCVDVSMSLVWAKASEGRAGCFSSGAQYWLGHRARLALGVEHFRLMGIYYPNEAGMFSFPDALIRDLAGNAFDASSFLAAWVALQAVLARCCAATCH